ncbi:hypothetical protein ACFJIY_08595 [Pimelobacter simplex]|uniref:hypothetical protein n=1 Tax=Nocardioides simplex TaxID=2045 RepID=UPI0036725338
MSELLAFGIFVAGGLSGWLLSVLSDVAKPRLVARLNRWIDGSAAEKRRRRQRNALRAAEAREAAELDRLRAERCGVRFRRHPDPKNPADVAKIGEVVDLGRLPKQEVRLQWTLADGTKEPIRTSISWKSLNTDASEQRRVWGWHEFERVDDD